MLKPTFHYTRDDLLSAIRRAGIVAGDVVSLQVSLGRLGMPEGTTTMHGISSLVFSAFFEVLGDRGTLIVPTYTYSIGRGEPFEVENTPSSIGEFTEIFRRLPDVIRSRDPMLSSAGIGPKAGRILRDISRSCYGEGSTFAHIREVNAKICTLGIGLHWATFRHHIEEAAGVPFRFKKKFVGLIREGGVESWESWIYFASHLQEICEPNGVPLEKKAREAGLVNVERVGRGELMCIDAQTYFEYGLCELRNNPWLTAKGPPCTLQELSDREDDRIDAIRLEFTLPPRSTVEQLSDCLKALPRDTVSEGSDAAIRAISTQLPLQTFQYATGNEYSGLIVPEKWTCRLGRISTEAGRELLTTDGGQIHVLPYSLPFHGLVGKAQLLEHIITPRTDGKNASIAAWLGKRRWGLSSHARHIEALQHQRYKVQIDCSTSYGTLNVGQSVIAGQTQSTVLLIARFDRRLAPLEGAASAVVAVNVMHHLARVTCIKPTVCLLLVPAAVGVAAWNSQNASALNNVTAVIVIDDADSMLRPVLRSPSAMAELFVEDEASGRELGDTDMTELDVPALKLACTRLVELICYSGGQHHPNSSSLY
jgi:aminoglycoside 3-N-acetyltransferase